MKINKKYAIRKLSIGVVSVAVGLLVATSSNLPVVNNYVSAVEESVSASKVIYSNPNANGEVDENGTNNNAISKIEVVNETDKKVRLRISIIDDVNVSKGFVLKTFETLYAGFNEPLSFNNEQVGTIPYIPNTIKNVKKPSEFNTIDEYYNYIQSLDQQSDEFNEYLKLNFNDNFKKYDKNRVLEFDLEIIDKKIFVDDLYKKNETSNEKTRMLEDFSKNVIGNIYINNNKIYAMKNPTILNLRMFEIETNKKEKEYDENKKIERAGSGVVATENKPTYLSNLYVNNPEFNKTPNDGSVYINATNKKVIKAGTKFRVKLNSNVVEFKDNNTEVVNGNLEYTENTSAKFENKEIFKGEQLVERKEVEKSTRSYYKTPVSYKKIDNNTYELEVLEDVTVKANSIREQNIELPYQLYETKLKEDFLNHLNISEYKDALKNGNFGDLFGTITTEIKEPDNTDYTEIDKKTIRANVATSYVFGESSTGTVKVKYVDENNKEISSLETIVENQPWYNKVDIPKKEIKGYEYVSSSQPLNDLVMSGERTVTLTYRSSEKTKEVPFETIYKADESLEKGVEEIETNGENGVVGYKENDPDYSRVIKPKVDKIVKIGTKPTEERKVLDSPVRYEKDSLRERETPNEKIDGSKGSSIVKITYTVDSKTGVIQEHRSEPIIMNPTETVIKVGAKDKISKETLPFKTIYTKDETRRKGEPNEILVVGKVGEKTIVTTYSVNEKEGNVTEKVGEPSIIPPVNSIIKVPAADEKKIIKEYNKVYEEITSYTVDENTGLVTSNVTKNEIGLYPQPPVVEIPEYTKPIGTNTPVDENGDLILPPTVEIPEYTKPIGTNTPVDENGDLILPPTVEIPEYTQPIGTNTPVDENGDLILPPTVEIPEYTQPIGTNTPVDENGDLILPPIVEIPEFNGGVNPTNPPVVEIPEYNGGVVPIDPPTVEIPEYTKPVEINTPEEVTETKENNKTKILPKTTSTQTTAYIFGFLLSTVGLLPRKKK